VRSRPDRQPEAVERRARGEEAQRARDAYVATPPFTLVTDEYLAMHESHPLPSIPQLKVKRSPRATAVNKYWFNPSWIAENERPEVDHGEFQSPVWLAVEMTMRSDRDRDRAREAHESGAPRHARPANEEPATGQLRSMLAFVSGAKPTGTILTPVTKIHPEIIGDKASATSRYHDLPQRPARPVRKFARFISSNFGRVSVNHN
jgi:hypothetical protein